MRQVLHRQRLLFCQWPEHAFTAELKATSAVVDACSHVLTLVHDDLRGSGKRDVGARGMTAEQVLRCALVMQQNEWTYRELAVQCADSQMTRAFVRLDFGQYFSKSCLQENISKIRPETWTKVNEAVLGYACREGHEAGRVVRLDSTVVEANIHHPTDSTLLFDCLRVVSREFARARDIWKDARVYFAGSLKEAKSLVIQIAGRQSDEARSKLYRKLLKLAKRCARRLVEATTRLASAPSRLQPRLARSRNELERMSQLLPGVIFQCEERTIRGKKLPPEKKIVSVFETHTDIIVKGQREVQYGHKVFLTSGASGLVLDCRIEPGNPNDSALFMDMMRYQQRLFGRPPRQTSADGGFATRENVASAKGLGVKDVCFSKACGLSVAEMTKSKWVFDKLRRFRAGIEGVISVLKRAFGLARATWSGTSGFHSYVKSAVVAYNLAIIARLTSA